MPTRRRALFIVLLVLLLCLVVPVAAHALAGGATGGGGGGGGGFSGGGGWRRLPLLRQRLRRGRGHRGAHRVRDRRGRVRRGLGRAGVAGLRQAHVAREGPPAWRRRSRTPPRSPTSSDGYWDPKDLAKRVRGLLLPDPEVVGEPPHRGLAPYVSDALYERHSCSSRASRSRAASTGSPIPSSTTSRSCASTTWPTTARTGSWPTSPARPETGWRTSRPGRWSTATSRRARSSSSTGRSPRHPEYGWVLDEIQQRSEGDYHLKAELVNQDTETPA